MLRKDPSPWTRFVPAEDGSLSARGPDITEDIVQMSFGVQSISLSSSSLNLLSAPNYGSYSANNQPTNPFDDSNGPFANLNLATDQKNQIDQIFANAKSQGLSPSQVQSQINGVLTTQQQQTLQSDLQTVQSQHHHHHGGGGSSSESSSLLSQLNLTSDQTNQIDQLVQNAQQNGTSASDLLNSIDNVLTSSQQTQLANLLAAGASYNSSGSSTTNNNSYLINTAV